MRHTKPIGVFVTVTALVLLHGVGTYAQRRPRPLRRAPTWGRETAPRVTEVEDGVVTMNYSDNVNLASFVDYVSQRLDLKIVYGDELKSQVVVFRPGQIEVPTTHLLTLLRSILRMRDLALVEHDVEGWLRIVHAGDMQRFAQEIRGAESTASLEPTNRVVTQVVPVSSTNFKGVVQYARQFLSSSKASVIEVPEKGLLIVTDYESSIAKALEIIRLVDVAPSSAQVETVAVAHGSASEVAERIQQVLVDKAKFEGRAAPQLTIRADPHRGVVLLVGVEADVQEAKNLLMEFDEPRGVKGRPVVYSPRYISAARLARLIEGLVGGGSPSGGEVQLLVDAETNRVYVTGSPAVQAQVEQLIAAEDVKSNEPSRPLRVYRPRNRRAQEIIGTLAEVLPNVTIAFGGATPEETRPQEPSVPPGPNRPPAPPGIGAVPPMPTAQEPLANETGGAATVRRVAGDDYTLTYDDHTNAIIAIGTREFHVKLEKLLPELDRRQPQVLIEMTLVAVTFNDSLSLAVELASEERPGDHQSLFFSSFGLSQVDLSTGARSLNPGGGINGIILGPHETPVLFRAIAAHGNSRIITTPKVVVSDGTTASIGSVEDAPFTSINASDTVATTSFAGYESAGTTLSVTPRIAQGEHLALDYSFNFSNFTGGGDVGVPPPRTTNTFSGSVEIPDGHTVIVGGLVTENEADSVTEVPILGRIPGIGVFFQSSDRARTKSRIFAFIRPTILRDDRFADLKVISGSEARRADIADRDYPETEYQWMR